MTVKIHIDPGAAGGKVRELTISEPTVTIGRDPHCAVVLSDPEKHVSRFHATIHRRDEAYHLTVGSKVNPVEVNGQPCGFGQSVQLTDGDTLAIPPFTMTFRIAVDDDATSVSQTRAPAHAWPDAPTQATRPAEPDPLDLGNLFSGGSRAPSAPEPDPFRLAQAPNQDTLIGGMANKQEDLLGALDAAPVDPLAALDRKSARPSPSSFGFDLDTFSLDSPPAGSASSPASAWQGSLAEDLPNPLVDLGDPRQKRVVEAPDHVHDFNLPYTPPPVAQQAPRSSPAPVPMPAAPATRAAPLAPVAVPAADATVIEARSATRAAEVFLKGLGLEGVSIAPADEEEFLRLASEITRSAVEGIMALLSSRGEMKKELRAPDRTMLAAHNNNPLKLMADAREALTFLFDPGQRPTGAFMTPAAAMQDACDDILAHEIGLVAGTRSAVEGAIRRFDPVQIEKLAEGDKAGGLLSNKRARLWDLYVDRYRKVELDLADNIDRLFERDFLRAYSEQVRRLRRPS